MQPTPSPDRLVHGLKLHRIEPLKQVIPQGPGRPCVEHERVELRPFSSLETPDNESTVAEEPGRDHISDPNHVLVKVPQVAHPVATLGRMQRSSRHSGYEYNGDMTLKGHLLRIEGHALRSTYGTLGKEPVEGRPYVNPKLTRSEIDWE